MQPRASSRSSFIARSSSVRACRAARRRRPGRRRGGSTTRSWIASETSRCCAPLEVALQAPALVHPRLEDPPARGAELLAPLRVRARGRRARRSRRAGARRRRRGRRARRRRRGRAPRSARPRRPAPRPRSRSRCARIILRGASAHVGVVDRRGASGAVDDRRQPVALGERHGRPDGEAGGSPSFQRPTVTAASSS